LLHHCFVDCLVPTRRRIFHFRLIVQGGENGSSMIREKQSGSGIRPFNNWTKKGGEEEPHERGADADRSRHAFLEAAKRLLDNGCLLFRTRLGEKRRGRNPRDHRGKKKKKGGKVSASLRSGASTTTPPGGRGKGSGARSKFRVVRERNNQQRERGSCRHRRKSKRAFGLIEREERGNCG